MPMLANPKHEKFCESIANGMKPVDAYEIAGYPRSPSSASQLKNKPEIGQRIAELISHKQDLAAAAGDDLDNLPSELNREWLVTTLMKNVKLAQDARQITPANKAVEMLAQLIGYSFKKPESNKDDEDGDKEKQTGGLDMDALSAGLDKIGSLVSNKAQEAAAEENEE